MGITEIDSYLRFCKGLGVAFLVGSSITVVALGLGSIYEAGYMAGKKEYLELKTISLQGKTNDLENKIGKISK